MKVVPFLKVKRFGRGLNSFSLVELLFVIAIIAILAGLTLAAAQYVMNTAARNRAKAEIQAMSAALDNYKVDNGSYPPGYDSAASISALTGPTNASYPTAPSSYTGPCGLLYQALSSKVNFSDATLSTTAPATGKSYMSFSTSQLVNYKTGGGLTYIKDPWNNAYGYSTGDGVANSANVPFSGQNFFDLWSTGGTATTGSTSTKTNSWIANWQQ